MKLLILNILLALLWPALNGQFTLENLTTGFILGYIVLFLLRRVFRDRQYFVKGWQLLGVIGYFFWELLLANLKVARDVLQIGPLRAKPRVVAIPIEWHDDIPLTMLANMISLTPGTLLLDISDDRRTIFLHVIHAPDPEQVRREIQQGFERQVTRLFANQPAPTEATKEHE